MQRQMRVTAQDLLESLLAIPASERRYKEVRVVFHGYNQLSFNLGAIYTRDGANGDDYLVVCEEDRP